MTRSVLKVISLVFSYLPVTLRHQFWLHLLKIGYDRWSENDMPQRIPFGLIVKYGPNVRMQEAAAMQFVYQHTSIPVPYVVDCYVHNGETWIIQEFIKGRVLSRSYRTMTETSCLALARNLGALLEQLRALRPPPDSRTVVCGFGDKPLYDPYLYYNLAPFGPFTSLDEFHRTFLGRTYLAIPEESRRSVLERIATAQNKSHEVVLTHNDLHPENILVDRHDHTKIIGIVDWENAGWLPVYW